MGIRRAAVTGRRTAVPGSREEETVRTKLLLVAVVALALLVPQVGRPAQASPDLQPCEFTLGFRTLRDMIVAQYGDLVGACITNETHNPLNGDGLIRLHG